MLGTWCVPCPQHRRSRQGTRRPGAGRVHPPSPISPASISAAERLGRTRKPSASAAERSRSSRHTKPWSYVSPSHHCKAAANRSASAAFKGYHFESIAARMLSSLAGSTSRHSPAEQSSTVRAPSSPSSSSLPSRLSRLTATALSTQVPHHASISSSSRSSFVIVPKTGWVESKGTIAELPQNRKGR